MGPQVGNAQCNAVIAEAEGNIAAVTMNDGDDSGERHNTIQFTLQVSGRSHLARVMRSIRQLQTVYRISRVRG